MKTSGQRFFPWTGRPLLAAVLLAAWAGFPAPGGGKARAFPPAPHHAVYGQVRDEQGNPFHISGATVLLEVEGGSAVRAAVSPGQAPGVNYQIKIPLDTGAIGSLYQSGALRPTVPFRLSIRLGSVTYLPLEMTGTAALLTKPAEATRLDLTLGVDSDGDGLPDAWENALIQSLGADGVARTLADIKPNDDSDGDGQSNKQEYVAGTYAYDSKHGFDLQILELRNGRSLLEFTAMRGRSYILYGSPNAKEWSRQTFRLASDPDNGDEYNFYQSNQTRRLRIWAGAAAAGQSPARYFRIKTQ